MLYCGGNKYGYRHLAKHIGQYFGGWGSFNFAISQVLKAPETFEPQDNGNYLETAPIYQCFFEGYYYIWKFTVIPKISDGTIVTAFGHRGRKVDQPCP